MSKGKITYSLRYYYINKQTRIDLGSYPLLSIKEARVETLRLRKKLEQGYNPKTVRQLERQAIIVFYKRVEKKESQGDDPEFYNMLKSYNVFNADQVEGYEPATGEELGTLGTVERIDQIEQFVSATGADIHEDKNMACYCPASDHIEMPSQNKFFETEQSATENYYAVLLHELTHWTGGKQRLNREQASQSKKESYAFEELIAELGSAFLCAQFEIKQQGRDDHARYIKSWLQALKNDKKFIFKASAQAQKAIDYLNSQQGA
ncbi:MAG: integrase arm-type DNA-binding domain-containing protein [Gammaproteobacteria bacterium]|nr:integrase arm-type DNA-binding domain-containing protein [Gammaproteobacteria bacterium]